MNIATLKSKLDQFPDDAEIVVNNGLEWKPIQNVLQGVFDTTYTIDKSPCEKILISVVDEKYVDCRDVFVADLLKHCKFLEELNERFDELVEKRSHSLEAARQGLEDRAQHHANLKAFVIEKWNERETELMTKGVQITGIMDAHSISPGHTISLGLKIQDEEFSMKIWRECFYKVKAKHDALKDMMFDSNGNFIRTGLHLEQVEQHLELIKAVVQETNHLYAHEHAKEMTRTAEERKQNAEYRARASAIKFY